MCSGNKCPTWFGLANKILDHIYNSGGINFKELEDLRTIKDPRRLLSIAWQIMNNNRTLFPNAKNWQNIFPNNYEPNIYDHLIEFRATYITVNYDLNIEYALKRAIESNPNRYGIKSVQADDSSPPQKDLNIIYNNNMSSSTDEEMTLHSLMPDRIKHLHGSIREPDHMIITIKDYIDAYAQDRPTSILKRNFLQDVFRKKTVLFAGTGASELEILEFLKFDPGGNHFILSAFYKSSLELANHYKKYFSQFGIELLPFLKDIRGQDQIEEIIKIWKSDISAVAKPPSVLEGMEEVFKGVKI